VAPVVLPGTASLELVNEICGPIGLNPGRVESERFSDGETWVKINENVRGRDVYVVQSTYNPANENLMELLLLIDAAKRASAERVNAVIPYFGYARQDRKDQGRVALSAKLVANLISTAGADRVISLELHASQIQGFFDIPVDHLYGGPLLVEHVRELGLSDCVVVSPDVGSVKRARAFARALDAPLAIIDKRRPKANETVVMNIIGDVRGENVLIFDDMIDTAGTLCTASEALREHGAKDVYACSTHAVLSGPAVERIKASCIKQVIVTNSIPQGENARQLGNLRVVSVAPLIGEAIRRVHNHQSVSSLFAQ
jgi:ribose-phosphate pyrophosphokinase